MRRDGVVMSFICVVCPEAEYCACRGCDMSRTDQCTCARDSNGALIELSRLVALPENGFYLYWCVQVLLSPITLQ